MRGVVRGMRRQSWVGLGLGRKRDKGVIPKKKKGVGGGAVSKNVLSLVFISCESSSSRLRCMLLPAVLSGLQQIGRHKPASFPSMCRLKCFSTRQVQCGNVL